MRRFEDKVVLLTGAASGIGRATGERLAREGASLFCLDVNADALEESAKRALALGAPAAETRVCDVSDAVPVRDAVRACVERFGRIDSLCHMAGILRMERFEALSREDWDRVLTINLTGTFLVCQAALPHLLASRGNIVNASSTAALSGLAYGAAYAASKAGVLAFTRSLAVEYAKQGLRANCVCPGSVLTPMTTRGALPKDPDMALIGRAMALDKPRGPEHVAGVIAMLASDDAAHVNGTEIRVDGGTLA